jgi:hypothetical protein
VKATKREVSHDPRKTEPRQRRSLRLNRKHPGNHSTNSSASTKAKTPKIVKSSSSTEKAKLETLYSPNKGSPNIIKNHEDIENSKSKIISSFISQVFFHMILKHLRYQRKTTNMIFTQRISIMHFYPNLTLRDTGTPLRRKLKKIKIM